MKVSDLQKKISDEKIIEICSKIIGEEYARKWSEEKRRKLIDAVRFGISLIPRIQGVSKEMENLLAGFKETISSQVLLAQ